MRSVLRIFLLSAFVITMLASCSKNKTPDAGGTILDKIIGSNNSQGTIDTIYYKYAAANRLTGITNSPTKSSYSDVYVYTYNVDGTLTGYKYSNNAVGDIYSYVCQYDGSGRLAKIAGTPLLANLVVDDHTFSYDSQGRMAADSEHYEQTSSSIGITKFVYDASSNIIETDVLEDPFRTGTFSSASITTDTYDKNTNPFYGSNSMALYVSFQGAVSLSKNNIVSQHQSVGSSIDKNINSDFYDYYSNGFVWHQVTSSPQNSSTITSEFYFRK